MLLCNYLCYITSGSEWMRGDDAENECVHIVVVSNLLHCH